MTVNSDRHFASDRRVEVNLDALDELADAGHQVGRKCLQASRIGLHILSEELEESADRGIVVVPIIVDAVDRHECLGSLGNLCLGPVMVAPGG
jgi:hypothetical protein